MSVKVRPYRDRGWEVDIQAAFPDGTRKRVRRKATVASRSEAVRWGQQKLRELLLQVPKPRKEAPTIAEFTPRFLDGYARANRHKPSGIAAKETILRVHVIPLLGHKRLDQISNEDVQALKAQLGDKAPKTVNNVLSVLSKLLTVAEEWSLIDHSPCRVRLVRTPPTVARFHDFDQYERLAGRASKSMSTHISSSCWAARPDYAAAR